ncbi:MAG: hypothetical protein KAU03_00520 [Candidatus Altiarchaeales archaeon]|nr:hypothetical protein [Candidatus Altiarchaeales archaeon]
MGDPKSQVSMEFLVTLSIVLLIFIVSLLVLFNKHVASNDLRLEISTKRLANTVADNINEISAVGPGYSQQFTIPGTLYGNREYSLVFYRHETRVEINAGETSSSPLFTSNVGCSMTICNTSTKNITLTPTNQTRIRLWNSLGGICLQDPLDYNLKQGSTEWRITPFRGKNTSCSGPNNCSWDPAEVDKYSGGDSSIYLYENTKNRTLSLVFRHGSRDVAGNGNVKLNLMHIPGGSRITLSDDNGELNLSQEPEGNWQWDSANSDDCDGGSIEFPFPCIRIQITPAGISTPAWRWINASGSTINLNKTEPITLTYP